MIAVNINAGLANQMFHYAFGRGLMAKGLDVCFDQTNFRPRKEWSFEDIQLQDAFPNIDIKQMPKGHFRWVCVEYSDHNKYYVKFGKLMRRLHNYIGDESYIMESRHGYIDGMEKRATRNCIYRGFWQTEKYFMHCQDDIRKQFVFLPFEEPRNIEISQKMRNENSVSIHFRKGRDYIRVPELDKLCSVEYYMNAIEYIKKEVETPVFYVFTDNPEWVEQNIPKFEYTLVNWNEIAGKRSFRDMQLMSCAKHNIIGNSTYSWWGAWLNPNPSKIVIAPKQFFIPTPFFCKSDIVCDNWIKF